MFEAIDVVQVHRTRLGRQPSMAPPIASKIFAVSAFRRCGLSSPIAPKMATRPSDPGDYPGDHDTIPAASAWNLPGPVLGLAKDGPAVPRHDAAGGILLNHGT